MSNETMDQEKLNESAAANPKVGDEWWEMLTPVYIVRAVTDTFVIVWRYPSEEEQVYNRSVFRDVLQYSHQVRRKYWADVKRNKIGDTLMFDEAAEIDPKAWAKVRAEKIKSAECFDKSAKKKPSKRTILVDFDGVIHAYNTPCSTPYIISDGPVDGLRTIDWLVRLSHEFDVKIFTTRATSTEGWYAVRDWLYEQTKKYYGMHTALGLIERIVITDQKVPAHVIIDDRAWCFDKEQGYPSITALRNFRPWNRRTSKCL